jgi:hypothetical protein
MERRNVNTDKAHSRSALNRPRMYSDTVAHVLLSAAALWDVAGAAFAVPPWWPTLSHVAIAVGIAAACVGVLLHLLGTRTETRARGRTALRLLLTGMIIGAWLLRGHPEIPPDLPIIATELIVAVLLVLARYRAKPAGPG